MTHFSRPPISLSPPPQSPSLRPPISRSPVSLSPSSLSRVENVHHPQRLLVQLLGLVVVSPLLAQQRQVGEAPRPELEPFLHPPQCRQEQRVRFVRDRRNDGEVVEGPRELEVVRRQRCYCGEAVKGAKRVSQRVNEQRTTVWSSFITLLPCAPLAEMDLGVECCLWCVP